MIHEYIRVLEYCPVIPAITGLIVVRSYSDLTTILEEIENGNRYRLEFVYYINNCMISL